ncbi:hypothetical protein D9M69_106410 [compost metagenome]
MTIHQKPEEPAAEIKAPTGLRETGGRLHPETLALHGGSYRFDPASGAVAVPIYQTTSYQLPGTDGADSSLRSRLRGISTPVSPTRRRTPSSSGWRKSKAGQQHWHSARDRRHPPSPC